MKVWNFLEMWFLLKTHYDLDYFTNWPLLDDIWGNINMNGDGHIGGEKFLTEASFFLNRILVATINTSLSLV